MLTGSQRRKIINGVKEKYLKEELDKSDKLREDLIKFIFDTIVSKLSPEELKFTKLYRDYAKSCLSLDFRGEILLKEYPDIGIKIIDYSCPLFNKAVRVSIVGEIDGETIFIPRLFDTWNEFKNKYPDDYKKAIEILKDYVITTKNVGYKINKLTETLELSGINLTELKNNFVELYNILKS